MDDQHPRLGPGTRGVDDRLDAGPVAQAARMDDDSGVCGQIEAGVPVARGSAAGRARRSVGHEHDLAPWDRIVLGQETAARLVLDDDKGSLAAQLAFLGFELLLGGRAQLVRQ